MRSNGAIHVKYSDPYLAYGKCVINVIIINIILAEIRKKKGSPQHLQARAEKKDWGTGTRR